MKFDSTVVQHLRADRFSSGLVVPISKREATIPDRLTLLEQIVSGKNVIHLGCTDHILLIEQKLSINSWLHARLCKKAKRCLGVDINQSGVDLLKNKFGYEDVICANLLYDDPPLIRGLDWDYLIMGELLEHVDDLVTFLSIIHERYSDKIHKLIITVPNAFAWANFKNVLRHTECINTDHRYWFTPYTLGKVVTRAGLKVENFQFCENMSQSPMNWRERSSIKAILKNFILRRYPAFRETLVMQIGL